MASPDYNLSQRESQILKLLVLGYSYKMIASTSFISINTMRTHLKDIYIKLHVTCGKEAISKALKDKIVKLD